MVIKESPNVSLNVGGSIYEVPRKTLQRYPESMLAKLVSEEWRPQEDNSTPIFIDRDGSRFQFVLDFLRDGKVHLPASVSAEALRADFAYYGLPENAYIADRGLGLSRISGVMSELYASREMNRTKAVATLILMEAMDDAIKHQLSTGKVKQTKPDGTYLWIGSFDVLQERVLEIAHELHFEVTVEVDSSKDVIICKFK